MGALALWLKSKFLGNSLTWIFLGITVLMLGIIVLPNLEQIKEKMGFETRTSLKVQVEEQKDVIQDLSQANNDLTQTVDQQSQAHNAIVENVSQHVEIAQKIHKETNTKIVHKRKQIKKIRSSDVKDKVKQVSTIQIDHIWDSYCSFNTHTQCNKGV